MMLNNINIVISFVQNMSYEDIKAINISNTTLYAFKKDYKKLFKTKLENIIEIYDYIQKYKTNIIGIDLGSNHYLAASNSTRTLTYIDNKNTVYNLFQKYKNRVNHKSYDNVLAYDKLRIGLLNHINQEINAVLTQFKGYKNIFVLGTHNYSRLSFSSLIFDLTYQSIKIRMGIHDEIELVDESFTSIECPNCMYRAKNNRTKSNHFRCESCNYYHENDDVVAASNIAKRGWSKINERKF